MAKEEDSEGLQTIFHIYSDGEYIGVLSDDKKVEQLKEDKLKDEASEYDKYSLTIGTKITIIQERVFTAGTDDELVLGKLQKMLSVEAEAIGIQVDGELALYVSDMSDYDEVIRKLKLQSVTEEELSEYEAQKTSTIPIPPLKENETRIAEIIMTGDVQPVKGQVTPDGILTVDKALVLLNKGTLEEKKYSVQSGDQIGKIASDHNMTTSKILEINPGLTSETILQIGDEFNVTLVEPFVEVEVHYESRKIETIPHDKITKNDSSLFKGDKKVAQEGSDGERELTELIRKRKGQIIGRSTLEEKVLVEPKEQITVVGTKVMPSRGSGSFQWPTVGGYISSHMGARWGRSHRGIDIARPTSRTIKASDNGVVTFVGRDGSYGNKIVINHNNGYETLYAHLSSTKVKVGQTVTRGASIGVMGSTGRSTGVHLHFEVTKNGSLINPMTVLK